MTIIVALVSRDFIVMGSDSLGSYSHDVIELSSLRDSFDSQGRLINGDGRRVQGDDIEGFLETLSNSVPYAHMTQVDKIFQITTPKNHFGVMTTGLSSLGDRSIDSLIEDFERSRLQALIGLPWTLEEIGYELHAFLRCHYEDANESGPLELIFCGFDPLPDGNSQPKVVSVDVSKDSIPAKTIAATQDPLYRHGLEAMNAVVVEDLPSVHLGGVDREIQRLIQGIDEEMEFALSEFFRNQLQDLESQARGFIRKIQPDSGPGSRLKFGLTGLVAGLVAGSVNIRIEISKILKPLDIDYAGMSVQKGIDFVDFLINIQTKSGEFSRELPFVGGEVQLALIQRDEFTWISNATRDWRHGQTVIPRRR